MNFDTRSFFAKLKSRKLLVLGAQWLLGAVLLRYGAQHPQYQGPVEWALGALGISGSSYHIAQAHEDAAAVKSPLGATEAIGGDVTLNVPPSPTGAAS